MSSPPPSARRNETNPLFSDNKLKLGIFGANVSNGCAITTARGRFSATGRRPWRSPRPPIATAMRRWCRSRAGKASAAPPISTARISRPIPGPPASPRRPSSIGVFTTSHVPTVHPVMAAKQAATVDHISKGRFALNIVCGWFAPELEMFGAPSWSTTRATNTRPNGSTSSSCCGRGEEEFDYEGKFLRVNKGFSMPKPIQKPFPPLMNAGSLGQGPHFAAKYADMAFIHLDPQRSRRTQAHIDTYRRLAREEYGREIQIWANGYGRAARNEERGRGLLRILRRRKGRRRGGREYAPIQGQQMHARARRGREDADTASRPAGAAFR